MCPAPPRSPTIVGSAVETIVWSSADSSMPSRIVTKMMFIWARDNRGGSVSVAAFGRTETSLIGHPKLMIMKTLD